MAETTSKLIGIDEFSLQCSTTCVYSLPVENWPKLLEQLHNQKCTGNLTLNFTQGTLASVQWTEKTKRGLT